MSQQISLPFGGYISLLRSIKDQLGAHFSGLSQPSRAYRSALGPRLARRIRHLDSAFHVVRHLDLQVLDTLRREVLEALPRPRDEALGLDEEDIVASFLGLRAGCFEGHHSK